MLRYYGGMPWIDHAYTAEDAMKFPRMTVEETVQKIVGLLDAAALCTALAGECRYDGRMTAASALALKSRVLQFVASPLFNAENPIWKEMLRLNSLLGMVTIHQTGGRRRWMPD